MAKDPLKNSQDALVKALLDQSQDITGIKPSDPQKEKDFQKHLQHASALRGRDFFYPIVLTGRGHGPFVEVADGSVKLDFITGIGVHYFGHSHPGLTKVLIQAAGDSLVMQGHLMAHPLMNAVSQKLLSLATRQQSKLKHVFITSSGAMANENAFKVLFHRRPKSSRLLAFERCFSGRTMACAQMTYKQAYRQGLPKVLDVDYVPFLDAASPRASLEQSISVLKNHLDQYPGAYAGMCFELIQGEGGYYPGSEEFFQALMKLCQEHDIGVMVDEIQTFARLPELFAFQHFHLDDYVDVVTVGKMTQICATLYTADLNPKPGLLSQTFTSSTAAIAAADWILTRLEEDHFQGSAGKINRLSQYFQQRLKGLADQYPEVISGPFGYGAMVAMTLWDGDKNKTLAFLQALYKEGLLAFIAGDEQARVRFLFPVGATEEQHIDLAIDLLAKTMDGFLKRAV